MRTLIIFTLGVALATGAAAHDLGIQAPPKSISIVPPNIPAPQRQGGDTIATALPIPSIPFADTGTTAGYSDDYDEICPYSNSFSPDVVYAYVPPADESVDIDLCGSDYDTKLYVYDADLALIACNDDFYFGAPCGVCLQVGERPDERRRTYYIVIDGYGS
jgi:hypothetical protein